jgi:putative transposase
MIHVHLVFVTKYRRKVFTKKIVSDLEAIFFHVCHRFQAELVECDGENDYIHLLINYPPTCTLSRLVNSLKGVSSRLIRKENYPLYQTSIVGEKFMVAKLFCWLMRRGIVRCH